MGHRHRVRTPFGYHALAHIGYRVEIEMRYIAHQKVAPVLRTQGYLLARDELERTMRAEMHHRIGFETATGPEISRDIGIRGQRIGAMHHLEGIFTRTLHRLRQQHHVAEADPSHGYLHSVLGLAGIVIARNRSILFCQSLVRRRQQIPLQPTVEIRCLDPLRIARGQIAVAVSFRIAVEDRTLLHHYVLELFFAGRQTRQIITGIAQGAEEMIQGRQHLQTCRRQGRRTGSFEIINGYLLVLISFRTQIQVMPHRLAKAMQSFGNRLEQIQPVLVLVLGNQRVRQYATVYLGHHYALAQETPCHTLLVGHPLLVSGVHRQGAEQGDILFAQPVHRFVPLPHQQAAMRQIDYRIGPYFLQERHPLAEAGHGIDPVSPVLKGRDNGIQMLGIGIERPGNARQQGNLALPVPIQAFFHQIGFVFGHRIEAQILPYMEKAVGFYLAYRLHRGGKQPFPAEIPADIIEQAPEIARPAITQIGFHRGSLQTVQIADIVIRTGHRIAVERQASIGQTLHFSPVLGRDAQPHPEHKHGIVLPEATYLVHAQGFHFHKGIARRPHHLGRLEVLEIEKSNPCGRCPMPPRQA